MYVATVHHLNNTVEKSGKKTKQNKHTQSAVYISDTSVTLKEVKVIKPDYSSTKFKGLHFNNF